MTLALIGAVMGLAACSPQEAADGTGSDTDVTVEEESEEPEDLPVLPLLHSEIPAGTGLLGLSIASGVARVNLSSEFESGGGTFSATTRVAQVVYALPQFPTVDAVEFYLDGELVDVFSGEGLVFDRLQEPEDYCDLIRIDA